MKLIGNLELLTIALNGCLRSQCCAKLLVFEGVPDIDLFASRLTRQLPKSVSWIQDPDSCSVNAFIIDWMEFCIYAFL